MVDEVLDGLHQAHFLGLAVHHRQQDHAETFLHLGVLEELVEHELGLAVALEFDHDAHAVAVAFVANVGNRRRLIFVVHQLRDALDQARLVHLIRNLGDDDGFAVFVEGFDGGLGAHDEAAAAVLVGVHDSGAAVNDAGGREIRALHKFQNLRELGVGIVHQRYGGVHDFGQVVGRNVRRHADRDAVRSVDQQVGNARGKNRRLEVWLVEVGSEVDGVFVDVGQHLFRDARHAASV